MKDFISIQKFRHGDLCKLLAFYDCLCLVVFKDCFGSVDAFKQYGVYLFDEDLNYKNNYIAWIKDSQLELIERDRYDLVEQVLRAEMTSRNKGSCFYFNDRDTRAKTIKDYMNTIEESRFNALMGELMVKTEQEMNKLGYYKEPKI